MDESDEGRDADDVEVFEHPPGVGRIESGEGSKLINFPCVLLLTKRDGAVRAATTCRAGACSLDGAVGSCLVS